jgi:hypothetical protein
VRRACAVKYRKVELRARAKELAGSAAKLMPAPEHG